MRSKVYVTRVWKRFSLSMDGLLLVAARGLWAGRRLHLTQAVPGGRVDGPIEAPKPRDTEAVPACRMAERHDLLDLQNRTEARIGAMSFQREHHRLGHARVGEPLLEAEGSERW